MIRKKLISGLCLFSILFTTSISYASEETIPATITTIDFDDKGTEFKTEYKGVIQATILSVALPTDMVFAMDPNADVDVQAGKSQTINAKSAVINNSVVPIDVSVINVTNLKSSFDTDEKKFQLVQKLSDVSSGTAILVVGEEGETFTDEAAFEAKALNVPEEGGQFVPLSVMNIPAGKTKYMQVFGKIASDVTLGYFSLDMDTTIKVECTRSNT